MSNINVNIINFDKNELALLADAVDMIAPASPLPDFDATIIDEPKSAIDCGRSSPIEMNNLLAVVEIDNVDLDKIGDVFNAIDDEVRVVGVNKPDLTIDEEYLNKMRYGPSGIPASEITHERIMNDPDNRLWPEEEFAKYMAFYNRNEPRPGKKLRFIDCKPNMEQRITRNSIVPATGANNTILPGSPGAFDEPLVLSKCIKNGVYSTPPVSPPRLSLATASNIVKPSPIRPGPIIPMKKPRLENKFRCKVSDIVEYVPELNRKLPAVPPSNFEDSTISRMYAAEQSPKKSYFKLANPAYDKVIQEADIVLKEGPAMMMFKMTSKNENKTYKWAPAVNRSNNVIHNDKGYILYISENGFAGTWKPHEDGKEGGVITTRRMTIDTENGKKRFSFKQRQIQVDVLMKNCLKYNIFNKWVGKK